MKLHIKKHTYEERAYAIHTVIYSSGVYICKSIVNHLGHGNYICDECQFSTNLKVAEKELCYLSGTCDVHIPGICIERLSPFVKDLQHFLSLFPGTDLGSLQVTRSVQSSGVYICKSIVNYLRHGNYICKSEVIYLTYEHRIEIPVEFIYVNQ